MSNYIVVCEEELRSFTGVINYCKIFQAANDQEAEQKAFEIFGRRVKEVEQRITATRSCRLKVIAKIIEEF